MLTLNAGTSLLLALAAPDSLVVRFIANEAVSLSDGRMTLVLDFPYQSGYSNYNTYSESALALGDNVTAVITHRHRDHFAAERFLATDWRIVGPREVTQSLPPQRVVPLDSVVRIGDAVIRPIRTPHSDTEHYSYVIEWKGRRFFFVGDTEDPSGIFGAGSLDVAFVSSWYWNAVGRDGRKASVRKVVLYHHMTDSGEKCDGCVVPVQGATIAVEGT